MKIMNPEEKARQNIDKLLIDTGWVIQDMNRLNLGASLGVVIREFPLSTGSADYMLFVDRKAVGVIEAKAEGTTLSGVVSQSGKYLDGFPENIKTYSNPLPFAYESTGVETFFRDIRDKEPKSRRLFAFHKPETLLNWVEESETLRNKLKEYPPLITKGLRGCQVEAVTNLEESFGKNRPRALIQMATGSGKTFTAITFIYRLIKYAGAKRILFLVDRNNLGRQTLNEFQQYITPDDGRKFTELYNVQHLKSNTIDPVSKVCITTIQRLYSMLKGENEYDSENEEYSLYDLSVGQEKAKEVVYNPNIPIETFDFIITDECHRSIYNLWRQVLEYFDSYLIGLTATPSKQTFGFFNKNLVMEYNHERAVADGVNVGFDVYRIKTRITEEGSKVEAKYYVDKRDRDTRKVRWEQLDEDLEYTGTQLDRAVVAKDQIRTVIRTYRDKLFTEIFPGRTEVPKTLIFAKDDSHAEDIVEIIRDEFGKGNDFCKKITYKVKEKPEELVNSFRNDYFPRIAITVDMISTGTDIKPVECLLFMRDIRSRLYFEQMIGRGTRTIKPDDLLAVTPDNKNKTHFIVVDAVGVCESKKIESRPLDQKKGIGFEKLIKSIALGNREEASLSSLAGRLSRLDKTLTEQQKEKIETLAQAPIKSLINNLIDAVDPDKKIEHAVKIFKTDKPTNEQINKAKEELADKAVRPFDNPDLRDLLSDIKKENEQIIDTVSIDEVIFAGVDAQSKDKALEITGKFKKFIEENKDEITALQILYNQPYKKMHVTFKQIKELAEAIKKPPYLLNQDLIWHAYEQLDKTKVKNGNSSKLLTNMISLIKYATGKTDNLVPFPTLVEQKFNEWIDEQKKLGIIYTKEQLEWLNMIKGHIATSLKINTDDFEDVPFNQHGGLFEAYELFGDNLNKIINELNDVLTA